MTFEGKTNIHKLAERSGMPQSETFIRILERAMTDDEAEFVLALPASFADLAAKFNMNVKSVEEKVLGLAQRGLLSRNPDKLSPEKFQFTNIPAILHDNILSSHPQYPGIIRVQHRGSAAFNLFQQFAFCMHDTFQRAKPFKMGWSNICNNADIRFTDFAKSSDFPGFVHPQLKNRPFVPGLQPEKRQWEPDLVIKIPFCR